MNQNISTVLNYHRRTKHSLERYAKSPETLDWDDQPNGFRYFDDCELIRLPKPCAELKTLFSELETITTSEPLNTRSVGLLLELAFGLSAWKQYGVDKWALRCNPSSGNLHPTEAYLINTDETLLKQGVYHYLSYEHGLQQRCVFNQSLNNTGLFIGLSSVHWREAWKYGERAYRYCQHDIGHALGCLRYAASLLGWKLEIITEIADDELSALLGLNREGDFKKDEREYPDVLCKIHPQSSQIDFNLDDLIAAANSGTWAGKAKPLNQYHIYKWKVIDEVTQAAHKPRSERLKPKADLTSVNIPSNCQQTATRLIRQRRSAQHFNPKATLSKAHFYQILSATLNNKLPFDMWFLPPKIHLFIFVHRVEGLEAGLYALPRTSEILEPLKTTSSKDFLWQPVTDELPLYLLQTANCRPMTKTLSCHQAIASDSAFSLAMVAEFSETIEQAAWNYRYLFWEAGLIGQVLYLHAEAAGVRGTGIGCYFDDSVHEILGIENEKFQSLYHFTIGTPLIDSRLQTFPAYAHLETAKP